MPVTRHFLGWDAPVTQKIGEFLVPPRVTGPVDLAEDLIVVPTRQAGRRLREALARRCAASDSALLSARVVTPAFLFRPADGEAREANECVVRAVWSGILAALDRSRYPALFPERQPDPTPAWALRTGEMLQNLRRTLSQAGRRIADVARTCGDIEEADRWRDLARLEDLFLRRLASLGLEDPLILRIRRAADADAPEGVRRIVLAATPDPAPLALHALRQLARRTAVAVLVCAPESLASHFDEWGRPVPEKWRETRIEVPDPEANLLLAASPAAQARRAVAEIAAQDDRGPENLAIGVPDRSLVPHLQAELTDRGRSAFDPADRPVARHPLYRLLEAYADLVTRASYPALAGLLRHPDVLERFRQQAGLSPGTLLAELDAFQNRYLPAGLADVVSRLPCGGARRKHADPGFPALDRALAWVREQADAFEQLALDSAVRSFLQTVYEPRAVTPGTPRDDEFAQAAAEVDGALRELREEAIGKLDVDRRAALALLLRRLAEQTYHPERRDETIDLEGWLELPWNDAPRLIVTGMNEGFVPDGRLDDAFLPDSLRVRLGLRDDTQRLARDAFLMRGLIESRRVRGRVCFLLGKNSETGDPLKPSRLLFRCAERDIRTRARALFGPLPEAGANRPASIPFRLDPHAPSDVPSQRRRIRRMPVTAFRDYLACPLRFYLKHVLEMAELDDHKREMDALDFGNLVHEALQDMADDAEMRGCSDEKTLARFLAGRAGLWVRRRFGRAPALPVTVGLEAAVQRLSAAARVQAALVREGWEIIESECKIETDLGGIAVSGKIDRVDRHSETGRIRILDYKTSDRGLPPEPVHLAAAAADTPAFARITVAGRNRRWVDLQLPLYARLLTRQRRTADGVELAYFNLPKAAAETSVAVWTDFSPALATSAEACAGTVVERIRAGVFGPPAEKVAYDDFARLFHGGAAACVADDDKGGPAAGPTRRRP